MQDQTPVRIDAVLFGAQTHDGDVISELVGNVIRQRERHLQARAAHFDNYDGIVQRVHDVVGADPGIFALTVAISTSNSFLIPTHQVNALLMGPGGYQVADFMRAGGIMTILFLIVSLLMLNLFV